MPLVVKHSNPEEGVWIHGPELDFAGEPTPTQRRRSRNEGFRVAVDRGRLRRDGSRTYETLGEVAETPGLSEKTVRRGLEDAREVRESVALAALLVESRGANPLPYLPRPALERITVSPRVPEVVAGGMRHPLPRPDIVLFGCRPLVPCHGWPLDTFHAPTDPAVIGGAGWPVPPLACPTCRGRTLESRDKLVRFCGWCDRLNEPFDTYAVSRRESGPPPEDVRPRRRRPDPDGPGLSEMDRRVLWNGGAEDAVIDSEAPIAGLGCESDRERIKITREWLTASGQEPKWERRYDRKSGRFSHPRRPKTEPAIEARPAASDAGDPAGSERQVA